MTPTIKITPGYTTYKLNDKYHREDGPAIVYADGDQAWYINGRNMRDDASFQKAAGISDDDMLIMILKYGHVSWITI